MRHKILGLVISTVVIASFVAIGCAPEAAAPPTPEEQEPPPEEEEEEAPPAAPEAEVVEWRMVTPGTAGTHWYYGHVPFADRVSEMTGGKFKIKVHPGGELFPIGATLDNVGAGAAEMAASFGEYYSGIEPAWRVVSYVTGNPLMYDEQQVYYHDSRVVKIIDDMHGAANCHYICHYWMPIETFMSKVPIRTLDDFKGVSVRASGASAALLKALGAQPVSMPSTEIYTAFQTGTIQAGEYSDFLVNWEAGIHEVTDYIIEPALHHCRVTDGGGEYMVNRDAWDALPDEYKAILEAACEENATNYLVSTMPKTAEAKQKMIDYGLEVITLPDEDVHEAYVLAQTTAWTWLEEQSDLAGELMEILYEYIELFGYEVAD